MKENLLLEVMYGDFYLPFCGPTLPSLKDELAVRSLSGMIPLSMPSGAMH